MAERDFYSEEYEAWHDYIRKMRKKNGWSWEETRLLGKDDEVQCRRLRQKKADDEDDCFTYLSDEAWNEYIDYLQREDENIICIPPARENSTSERYSIPRHPFAAWQCYAAGLAKKNFAPAAIRDIENASNKILQRLQDGSKENDKLIHGLVIGNVQSGKTANMEGLMSMAADAGFNLFIILSGTIESLRQQTRSRFASDLKSKRFSWEPINHPDTQDPDKNPSNLDFSATSNVRYYTVCLKNSRRLEKLLYWLNYDEQKKKQMKVLLIDDESDQASLNTKKMDMDSPEEQERTAINKAIMRIVNGNKSKDSIEKAPYKAMNYLAYTATPYGNVLNENGEDSLYPSDFITLLASPDTYFGPKQIFGDSVNGTADPLPIVNEITVPRHDENDSAADTAIIESIKEAWEESNGKARNLPDIPQSLKEAIAWFVIATAIRRYNHAKKPVSMLVHHSMKTVYHISTATDIRHWYQRTSFIEFIGLCRKVYQKQTQKLTRDIFASIWPSYGRSCGISLPKDINDYPPFDELVRYIQIIKENGIEHIPLKPDGNEYQYTEGIHLCVDNSTGETVGNNGDVQVRLIYPQAADKVCDAPAFLVVGGNTLSRGLTLEGLVCTYFSRDVSQADTLMQMGRWFGYRRGYELLPRIWMTPQGLDRFQELSALDIQLRSDIQNRYLDDGLTPAECGPMVAKTVLLALTAKNKMQGAEELNIDFSGQHLQTFKFPYDESKLRETLECADRFISSLGESDKDGEENSYRVWRNVSFDAICGQLLDTELFVFGQHRKASEFCEEYKQTGTYADKWNVILQGKKSKANWHGVGKVARSRFKDDFGEPELFNIGILSDPSVWKSDMPQHILDNLTDAEKKIIVAGSGKKQTNAAMADFRQLQDKLRQRAGIDDVPRLVIYCIDHENPPRNIAGNRTEIATSVDVIGVEILMPKRKGAWKKGFQVKK